MITYVVTKLSSNKWMFQNIKHGNSNSIEKPTLVEVLATITQGVRITQMASIGENLIVCVE